MTYGEAATSTVKGLAQQPGFLLIAVLNVGMIFALMYVASAQRDERQLLTKYVVDSCAKGATP
jgi:hypothetical protein